MSYDADIINDCIKIFNEYKDNFLNNLEIVDIIDDYYDNYDDIKNSIINEFVNFVKNKTNGNYTYNDLREFLNSNEFKNNLKNLRDSSNIEYYIYITNKHNKNKIKELERKINFLFISNLFLILFYLSNYLN
jgi:hypothetical protein